MSLRDTATALAQRAPGNFLGVVLYAPMGNATSRWDVVSIASPDELRTWYEKIAAAPPLYYYAAAFDKGRGNSPVAATILGADRSESGRGCGSRAVSFVLGAVTMMTLVTASRVVPRRVAAALAARK